MPRYFAEVDVKANGAPDVPQTVAAWAVVGRRDTGRVVVETDVQIAATGSRRRVASWPHDGLGVVRRHQLAEPREVQAAILRAAREGVTGAARDKLIDAARSAAASRRRDQRSRRGPK